ncbi:MAG: DUF58 domain-containing protein [Candidatus Anammoximicrobium sp.]|nr:DUF58 domain-containing protein [Candidatus Anammoximicrobium sp.]
MTEPPAGNKAPTSLDPQTLAKLKGLTLRARHIVEGYVSGLHRSPYHGFSIEFAEHREYAPGDDLRYLDWKVFGRTDKYYLKQYENETNLICYLVLDVSESMRYQGPGSPLSKFEYAQCIAAAVAWLVLQQQDAVSLVTFDDQIRANISPSSSAPHLRQLLQVMESAEVRAKTAAGPIFHELAERFRKRGVVFILSDLFDDVPAMLAGLKHFRHRRHDVILFHVLDAAELDFPFRSPTLFRGLEQMPQVVADPRSLRKAYLRELAAYQQQLQYGCRSHGMDYHLVRTDQPLDAVLSTYLGRRTAQVK